MSEVEFKKPHELPVFAWLAEDEQRYKTVVLARNYIEAALILYDVVGDVNDVRLTKLHEADCIQGVNCSDSDNPIPFRGIGLQHIYGLSRDFAVTEAFAALLPIQQSHNESCRRPREGEA